MQKRISFYIITMLHIATLLHCADFNAVFCQEPQRSKFLQQWDWFFESDQKMTLPQHPQLAEDFNQVFNIEKPAIKTLSIDFPFSSTVQVSRPISRNLSQTPFKVRAVSQLEEKDFCLHERVLQNKKLYQHFMHYMKANPIRIFCDTETTGISQYDRIIEIAFVKRNYQTMKETRWYSLLNPDGKESGPKAYEAHKIKDADLVNQPKFLQVYPDMEKFIGHDILVAHNVAFDRRMINSELKRIEKVELPPERFECTLVYARSIYEGEKNTLDAVCERLGVNLSSRNECHGAMQDTLLLADIYPTVFVAYQHIKGK